MGSCRSIEKVSDTSSKAKTGITPNNRRSNSEEQGQDSIIRANFSIGPPMLSIPNHPMATYSFPRKNTLEQPPKKTD